MTNSPRSNLDSIETNGLSFQSRNVEFAIKSNQMTLCSSLMMGSCFITKNVR